MAVGSSYGDQLRAKKRVILLLSDAIDRQEAIETESHRETSEPAENMADLPSEHTQHAELVSDAIPPPPPQTR